jgi:SpoVK/Ycf46/Vps4 family AAA+-type ATPase
VELIRAGAADPDLLGIEDEDAGNSGDSLLDGLPVWLNQLGGVDLFVNYDPALLRRIQRHIHFRLPNASMRRELFSLHLPNPDLVTADYAVLAGLSRGLSGGDILNVCVNAIYAGRGDSDSTKWAVTQAMIEEEIKKTRKAKAEH